MMVQNLAGSLALVTCKEPLRHNMVNQLRGIIQKYFAAAFANEVMDSNALEPAVQMIAQDNLVSMSCGRAASCARTHLCAHEPSDSTGKAAARAFLQT